MIRGEGVRRFLLHGDELKIVTPVMPDRMPPILRIIDSGVIVWENSEAQGDNRCGRCYPLPCKNFLFSAVVTSSGF
jgi:hypothetical protein